MINMTTNQPKVQKKRIIGPPLPGRPVGNSKIYKPWNDTNPITPYSNNEKIYVKEIVDVNSWVSKDINLPNPDTPDKTLNYFLKKYVSIAKKNKYLFQDANLQILEKTIINANFSEDDAHRPRFLNVFIDVLSDKKSKPYTFLLFDVLSKTYSPDKPEAYAYLNHMFSAFLLALKKINNYRALYFLLKRPFFLKLIGDQNSSAETSINFFSDYLFGMGQKTGFLSYVHPNFDFLKKEDKKLIKQILTNILQRDRDKSAILIRFLDILSMQDFPLCSTALLRALKNVNKNMWDMENEMNEIKKLNVRDSNKFFV